MEHEDTFGRLTVGSSAKSRTKVTHELIRAFAEVSGDRNPVHLDSEFASSSIFGGIIAHGLLTASFISALIANELPGPGSIYLSQSLRFLKPVKPGDEVDASVCIASTDPERRIVVLETNCKVNDEAVLTGEAKVKVP